MKYIRPFLILLGIFSLLSPCSAQSIPKYNRLFLLIKTQDETLVTNARFFIRDPRSQKSFGPARVVFASSPGGFSPSGNGSTLKRYQNYADDFNYLVGFPNNGDFELKIIAEGYEAQVLPFTVGLPPPKVFTEFFDHHLIYMIPERHHRHKEGAKEQSPVTK